ncbi:MAG: hypothetical protein GX654_10065 [Desulfatiglans sp.]|nr:hypothetical protein [Desulfatiglans sp.]
MRKTILLLVTIFLLIQSHSFAADKIPEIPVSKQSGISFEKDINLKKTVLNFLYYESCDSSKERDYKGMYGLLSRNYLSENFPHVNSALEYDKEMKDINEIYHLVYLMVENVVFIKKDKVKIKVKFESGDEGVLQIMEEDIFFILENGLWKYEGVDIESSKVIETIE